MTRRCLPGFITSLIMSCIASSALAQVGDGFVGVYADAQGTTPCTEVPEGTGTTLYVIATLAGESSEGIRGAEFRVEVENPSGWSFNYSAPGGAFTLGNPMDLDPEDGDDGSGLAIAFTSCTEPPAGSIQVALGSIWVQNNGGDATNLLVKRHSNPSNRGLACALFVNCSFDQWCMEAVAPTPCTTAGGVEKAASDEDPIVFVAALNKAINPVPPGLADLSLQVVAMFPPGIIQLPVGLTSGNLQNTTINSTEVESVLAAHDLVSITIGFPDFVLADTLGHAPNGEAVRLGNYSDVYILSLPLGGDQDSLAIELDGLDDVVFADPNGIASPGSSTACDPPDDLLFPNQWSLNNTGQSGGTPGADIEWLGACELASGDNVILGIVDYEIDAHHEDLAGKVFGDRGYTTHSHGTEVASVAAAYANNGVGIAGVAPDVQIVFRNIADNGSADDPKGDIDLALDIRRLSDLGAQVINASWFLDFGEDSPSHGEGMRRSNLIRAAFRDVYMSNRASVVMMGNAEAGEDPSEVRYPAGYGQGIIAVGATNADDVRAQVPMELFSSSTGPHIDVTAPGTRIWAATAGANGYSPNDGTSLATAHVSGIAALLLDRYPWLHNDDVEQLIRIGVVDKGVTGFDSEYGTGRVNARMALETLESPYMLVHDEVDGTDQVLPSDGYRVYFFIVAPPGLDPGGYLVRERELRKTVTFPVEFQSPPKVWGRGWKTTGYAKGPRNFSLGWCEPVEGSVTASGCTLRSYRFEVWDREKPPPENLPVGVFPLGATFAYSALGLVSATDVSGGDEVESTVAPALSAPSPFRVGQRVSLEVPKTGVAVRLEIFDVTGRRVHSLFRGRMGTSAREFAWDGKGARGEALPSGVYIARAEIANVVLSRKLVLLR